MFPSPGRAVMALAHHAARQAPSPTTPGAAMPAPPVSTSTNSAAAAAPATIAFSFQPSPPTSAIPHGAILGYSPLVLVDHHPTTTTTTTTSSSTIHHGIHGGAAAPPAIVPSHPPRSSPPPHPWSCEEGDRGKGAAVMGMGIDNAGGGGMHAVAAVGSHQQHQLGIGAVRMKKAGGGGGKARRKVREPRFCFKTMSDVDVLDDGYKWRKYGQKVVKNTQHPRSYYRCTQDKCRVKKRVERLAEDPRMVITTYEGRHVHSPSRDDDAAARATAEMTFIW